jgi:hypothetical protein
MIMAIKYTGQTTVQQQENTLPLEANILLWKQLKERIMPRTIF